MPYCFLILVRFQEAILCVFMAFPHLPGAAPGGGSSFVMKGLLRDDDGNEEWIDIMHDDWDRLVPAVYTHIGIFPTFPINVSDGGNALPDQASAAASGLPEEGERAIQSDGLDTMRVVPVSWVNIPNGLGALTVAPLIPMTGDVEEWYVSKAGVVDFRVRFTFLCSVS